MRNLVLVLFFCLAGSRAFAADDAPRPSQAVRFEEAAIARGIAQAQSGDTADASETLSAAIARPAFKELDGEEQHQAYAVLGAVLVQRKDPAALAMLKLATQSPYAGENDWRTRLDVAYRAKDYRDAVVSLTTIVQRWPGEISDYKDEAIFLLGATASKVSDDAAIALLAPLHATRWRPSDMFSEPDSLWYDLAVAYLNKHKDDDAAEVLDDVHNPAVFIQIHADNRFDGVVARDPEHFDFARALEDEVGKQRFLVGQTPNRLGGVIRLTGSLIETDHASEALDLLDRTIARALPSERSSSRYQDYDDQMSWVLNERAIALFALGRSDEGLNAYQRSVGFPSNNLSNVGQTINLAGALTEAGKPKEALDALAFLDPNSLNAYGKMSMTKVRACAYAQLGDKEGQQRAIDYAKAHAADSSRQLFITLLCTNDLDGLAHAIISELQNPVNRGQILYTLQSYQTPAGETAIGKEWTRRYLAVRSRPDVAAAIARFGRIGSYPLVATFY